MSLQQVAQRAFDYAHACAGNTNGVNSNKNLSRSKSQSRSQSNNTSRTNSRYVAQSTSSTNESEQVSHKDSKKQTSSVRREYIPKSSAETANGPKNASNEVGLSESTEPAQNVNNENQNSYSTAMNKNNENFSYDTGQGQNQGDNPLAFLGMNNSGWGKYISSLGMGGFSDVYHNLGYVLAMLPDLLIGVFTGQKDMSLKNNLLPIGMVLAGLFTKRHPLIKLMLLGFGGASLLNNAGHRILGDDGRVLNQKPKEPIRYYKTYADEPLNTRMKDPVVKDNVMCVDIDGKPMIISISNYAIDAYNKKALPLNTLANAVLAKYDEKQANVQNSYSQSMSQQDKVEQEVKIK